MYISHETPERTQARLLAVIAGAELRIYEGGYAFEEVPREAEPADFAAGAMAVVRDEEVTSRLVRSTDPGRERFALFRFHFPPGTDNSGFVGWLASHLKETLGTGVFVVCGQNSGRGGIFDYWGAPLEMGASVAREVKRLRELGGRLGVPRS